MNEEGTTKKRPKWVWVIFIFFCVSAGGPDSSLYLLQTGATQLQPAQQVYFDDLSNFDYVITFLIRAANIIGAVTLLMLRAISFYLFSAALAGNVITTIWHILNKGLAEAVGGAGMFGALVGLAIASAVCVYTYNLKNKRVIT